MELFFSFWSGPQYVGRDASDAIVTATYNFVIPFTDISVGYVYIFSFKHHHDLSVLRLIVGFLLEFSYKYSYV